MNNLIFNNNRGENPSNKSKKNKLDIKKIKKNTLNSLNDVEHFLRDFKRLKNYIKLYKILK